MQVHGLEVLSAALINGQTLRYLLSVSSDPARLKHLLSFSKSRLCPMLRHFILIYSRSKGFYFGLILPLIHSWLRFKGSTEHCNSAKSYNKLTELPNVHCNDMHRNFVSERK